METRVAVQGERRMGRWENPALRATMSEGTGREGATL